MNTEPNREHKYRVWDKEDRKMVYFTLGDLLASYNDEGDYPTTSETDLFRIRNDINPNEAMDFILKNREGYEIYEGDIVAYKPFESKGVVTWVATFPGFSIINHHKKCAYVLHDEYELLGNIYENPELIEGAKLLEY